jgi:tetratricopeptide (TPR) repeat protein
VLQDAVGHAARHGFLDHAWRLALTLREFRDPYGEGECWTQLGESHHLLGEYTQAMACYRRAAALWQELGRQADEAAALVSVGDSALAAGNGAQAREAWETAVILLSKLGLASAGEVRRKLHRLAEAAEPHARSRA